ncbi:head decoration protein [Burkholderia cenocepacia]|uniref:head decoration protein n=1 Tax=Burkholderia cenocepacia TaxID=95486 RepID=UPI001BA370C9|nr:head decoration protein [Burkholderia cenocepacia]MBR8093809.1 head decoration protein [Burkholderia cenocepacia]
MSNVKTMGILPGEFLISEGPGRISRDPVSVVAGPALVAGTLLGATATGEYAPYDNAGKDGAEIAVGILYAPLAASEVARPGVAIKRLAEVDRRLLTGLDAAARDDLAEHHIVIR